MLEIKRVAPHQRVSLDDCGDAVMLELEDGHGHAFRQALDANDVGCLLAVCRVATDKAGACEGDLVALARDGGIVLGWFQDGGNPVVHLDQADKFVFEEALKSHCKALMKPVRTPIL